MDFSLTDGLAGVLVAIWSGVGGWAAHARTHRCPPARGRRVRIRTEGAARRAAAPDHLAHTFPEEPQEVDGEWGTWYCRECHEPHRERV